jgi:hypothetical protein
VLKKVSPFSNFVISTNYNDLTTDLVRSLIITPFSMIRFGQYAVIKVLENYETHNFGAQQKNLIWMEASNTITGGYPDDIFHHREAGFITCAKCGLVPRQVNQSTAHSLLLTNQCCAALMTMTG